MYFLILLIVNIIGGLVLVVGWEVNVMELGVTKFLIVWVIGSMILTTLPKYLYTKLST